MTVNKNTNWMNVTVPRT